MSRSPRFIALLIIGGVIILAGLGYGISSSRVAYQQVGQGTIAHYLSANGTGYLQMSNSPTLYLVHETDFTPIIQGINTFADGDAISLVYNPSDTTPIDVTSKLGTHLSGSAYQVVEITAYDKNQQVYKTAAYSQDPQSYGSNHWGGGISLIVVGAILMGIAFFTTRRKAQPAFTANPPSMAGTQPPMPPYQQSYPDQPATAYGQPNQQSYPGAVPYPSQLPQYPQYPQNQLYPQPGWVEPTRVANPYNLPYPPQ
jgi:hypothetical protein